MKNKINLNNDIGINTQILLQSRMVILANSGGGKSYAIRKFAEDAVSQTQTIIIDPEGEFASLREKHDFILAGKGADVPVEVRSAALLATKLLELGKSAIIDLYELHPQERQRYVKLFFDAMVNAPKELYHPVFIILDEAHEFAPEGKPSEATWSVEALASKGRKRGFCLIPASQRIAKLSKNLTAECNNKLIGRASQDIDMKRAGDELGFSKEKLVQLRQLKPGEFFAFGPAISDEVIKLKIGEVKTTHAKVDYKGTSKVPPPSHVIKKVLGELADLPQEAEKEAKTVAEFKKENTELKRMNTNLLKHPFQKDETYDQGRIEGIAIGRKESVIKEVPVLKDSQIKKMESIFTKMSKEADRHGSAMALFWGHFGEMSNALLKAFEAIQVHQKNQGTINVYKNEYKHIPKIKDPGFVMPNVKIGPSIKTPIGTVHEVDQEFKIGKGEMIVLNSIAQYPEGMTTEHIAVLTGYKSTSRRAYLQRLTQKGYIETHGGTIFATEEGIQALGSSFQPLPTGEQLREHLMRTLPEGEKRVLSVILNAYPNETTFELIEEATGYKSTSRRVYLQRLGARKLIEVIGNNVRASEKLYE